MSIIVHYCHLLFFSYHEASLVMLISHYRYHSTSPGMLSLLANLAIDGYPLLQTIVAYREQTCWLQRAHLVCSPTYWDADMLTCLGRPTWHFLDCHCNQCGKSITPGTTSPWWGRHPTLVGLSAAGQDPVTPVIPNWTETSLSWSPYVNAMTMHDFVLCQCICFLSIYWFPSFPTLVWLMPLQHLGRNELRPGLSAVWSVSMLMGLLRI